MAAKNSTTWPPPGWKAAVEVKNGRKTKYYINVKSGQKLYSKTEVISCLKSVSISSEKSQTTNQLSKISSGKKDSQIVQDANKFPEWLPDGWTMEWKIRNSGSRKGTTYKCYMDPSTGSKFYSKPEVSRYLKSTQHSASLTGSKKTGISMHAFSNGSVDPLSDKRPASTLKVSQSPKAHKGKNHLSKKKKVVIERTVDEGLPPGWIKEIRIKGTGNQRRKDTFYTNLATGHVFCSRVAVRRYLETGVLSRYGFKRMDGGTSEGTAECKISGSIDPLSDKRSASKPEVTQDQKIHEQNNHLSEKSKVVVERTVDEVLPPGWIKETRIRGTGPQCRRDSIYINPATGYVFRSRVGVLRYLETGVLSRHAYKRKNSGSSDELADCMISSPSAKRRKTKTTQSAARECLFAGGSSEEQAGETERGRVPSTNTVEDQTIKQGPPTEVSGAPKTTPLQKNRAADENDHDFAPKRISSKKKLRSFKENQGDELSEKMVLAPVVPSDDSQEKCSVESTVGKSTENKAIYKGKGSAQNKPLDNGIENCSISRAKISKSKSKNRKESRKDLISPCRSSKRLAGIEAEPVTSSVPLKRALRAHRASDKVEAATPSLGSLPTGLTAEKSQQVDINPQKQLATPASCSKDPTNKETMGEIENPSKNLNDKKPSVGHPLAEGPSTTLETNVQPESHFYFPALWSDPCLEFAYKTLTGAIPFDENLDYVQHQLHTSAQNDSSFSAVPGISSSPSFFPDDAPLQFDMSGNPVSGQPSQTKPPFSLLRDQSFPDGPKI
ncbi:hypothetical protein Nepgr_011256 [Nepenthes gracilis]|uniref:MBD domain-containing protein n=1 Tax=Nepenthes gracilis TaxID=150966 RepID=A0AAD3SEW0_NEPGR|nr:hypothetical protein Nepgr_011256 [Nepenthes gracilis]